MIQTLVKFAEKPNNKYQYFGNILSIPKILYKESIEVAFYYVSINFLCLTLKLAKQQYRNYIVNLLFLDIYLNSRANRRLLDKSKLGMWD